MTSKAVQQLTCDWCQARILSSDTESGLWKSITITDRGRRFRLPRTYDCCPTCLPAVLPPHPDEDPPRIPA